MKTKIKILLIEDNLGDVRLVQESLRETKSTPIEWAFADHLENAFEKIQKTPFDIILLDLSLPDSQGLDTFLKLHNRVPNLPIVILTSTDDELLALEAVQKGAQDYLVKGQTPSDLLMRAIRYAIERHQLKQKLSQAQQKSVETERLRVLIETAGAAAHEINQPLTAVLGHVELILTSEIPNPFRQDLQFVLEAAERIQEIVKSMNDIQHYQTKPYIGNINIVDFQASSATTSKSDHIDKKTKTSQ
jgi:CheY-like chemotaxis protein